MKDLKAMLWLAGELGLEARERSIPIARKYESWKEWFTFTLEGDTPEASYYREKAVVWLGENYGISIEPSISLGLTSVWRAHPVRQYTWMRKIVPNLYGNTYTEALTAAISYVYKENGQ